MIGFKEPRRPLNDELIPLVRNDKTEKEERL